MRDTSGYAFKYDKSIIWDISVVALPQYDNV